MKKIARLLSILSILCISWRVQAHQPDLASIILAEQEDNKWILQVRSALTAFDYEIEEYFGEGAYATPEEFQELVVNYTRERIAIRFNEGDAAVLQHGMVKLGHETNVIFQLEGIPETIHSLMVESSTFSDIPNSQGVLMIYKEGYAKNQFMLNKNNGHSIRLEADGTRFVVADQQQGRAQPFLLLIAGLGLAVIAGLVFFYQKNQGVKLNNSTLFEHA